MTAFNLLNAALSFGGRTITGLLSQPQTRISTGAAATSRLDAAPTSFDRRPVNLEGFAARATTGNPPPHEQLQSTEVPDTTTTSSPDTTSSQQQTPAPQPRRQVSSSAKAYVYDASSGGYYGTTDNLGQGQHPAQAAARNVQNGFDYYASAFGRDGIDGAGTGVNVLINDRSRGRDGRERFAGNGGYYATTYSNGSVQEAIHFGTGTQYQGRGGLVSQYEMLYADDLAVHELTHGIIRKETGYLGGGANEQGATNEAIADVMAASATRDWRIGEGMYSAQSDYRLMRNIAQPDDPTAIHGLWTHMSTIRELQSQGREVEEHWASGVLSTAAYRMQQRLGGEAGWQAIEQVFYHTVDNNWLGDMSFASVAAGLRYSAADLYGQGSDVARIVDEELQRGGM